MTPRRYHILTAAVFAVVGLLHLARIALGWQAVLGGWSVPMWLSWAALLVSGSLAWWGLRLSRG